MNHFYIEITLPDYFSEDFIRKIPQQREVVDDWMQKGIILNYALAYDRSKLWIAMLADSEQEVMDVLATFPLVDYMKPDIFKLAFYQGVAPGIPSFSLN
ncbi:MAG: hypothetical protein K1X82_03210 [Bacteroidia bacterium]|nr:hypothetical protein [Bacteroidia bacterium]